MPDNSAKAKALAQTLASPTAPAAEVAEAREQLQRLADRGVIYSAEVLKQFPAVQVSPHNEQPTSPEITDAYAAYLAQGVSPALAAILADCDALLEANRVENIRLAPVRAERRAELEAAMLRANLVESRKHGYRRTLESYQENYSFAEETRVFDGLIEELGREQCKQTSKG